MDVHHDNELTGAVIGAAIEVHRELGPGLEESAYEEFLQYRLSSRGLAVDRQRGLPLVYKGVRLDCGYRLDLLVDHKLPIELKSVEKIHPIHEAQILTYMRIGRFQLGLLMNFNVAVLKDGLHRKIQSGQWVVHDSPSFKTMQLEGVDTATGEIVGAAVEVHRNLGPGLLPSAYETALCYELSQRHMPFQREVAIPLVMEDRSLSTTAEIPLLVDGQVPVFCMCVDELQAVLSATLRARLRQGNWKRGLLLNFNEKTMLAGIKRICL